MIFLQCLKLRINESCEATHTFKARKLSWQKHLMLHLNFRQSFNSCCLALKPVSQLNLKAYEIDFKDTNPLTQLLEKAIEADMG